MGIPSKNSVIFEKCLFGKKKIGKLQKLDDFVDGMAAIAYMVL